MTSDRTMRTCPFRLPAALAIACIGAAAGAQSAPAFSEDNLILPVAKAHAEQLDVGIFNPAKQPLTVWMAPIQVGGVINGETIAFPSNTARIQSSCAARGNKPLAVPAQGSCTIGVSLSGIREPGQYTVNLALIGEAGERENVSLDFARRRPLWWAILLVLAGLMTGALITYWRGGGRDRAQQAITIKEAAEALKRLDAGVLKPGRINPLLEHADALQRRVLRGEAVDDAEIEQLRLRVPQYQFLLNIEALGAGLGVATPQLDQKISDAIEKMLPGTDGKLVEVPATMFDEVRDALKALRGGPELAPSIIPLETLPLPITIEMTSASARDVFALIDWVVALILMLLFVALALGSLYYGAPYWGGYGDLVAAFMVGFGAYAGAVASVDTFLQGARRS